MRRVFCRLITDMLATLASGYWDNQFLVTISQNLLSWKFPVLIRLPPKCFNCFRHKTGSLKFPFAWQKKKTPHVSEVFSKLVMMAFYFVKRWIRILRWWKFFLFYLWGTLMIPDQFLLKWLRRWQLKPEKQRREILDLKIWASQIVDRRNHEAMCLGSKGNSFNKPTLGWGIIK